MDLERLHYSYLSKPARGGGRTYDMMVTVVQCADWPDVSPILVVIPTPRDIDRMMAMASEIAHDMGYHAVVLAHGRMRIETTEVVFRPSAAFISDRPEYAEVFQDHYVQDFQEKVTNLLKPVHRPIPFLLFDPPPHGGRDA